GSGATYIVGSAVGGAGFGLAYLGGLRALGAVIPERQRAGVMAALYLVAYASLSLPAVLAGLLLTRLGLPITLEVFRRGASGVARAVAAERARTGPARTVGLAAPRVPTAGARARSSDARPGPEARRLNAA